MAFFMAALPYIIQGASALASAKASSGSAKNRGADTLRGVDTPDLEAYKLPKLEEYKQVGLYTPEAEQTVTQDPSAFESLFVDPTLRGQQMDSLAQYQQIIDGGGRDAQAMALLEDILGRQRTASRGAQDAIMANARARGLGGSDLEFVNRMIAQQQQATAGSRAAIDAAAMAQARKDQALQQSAQLAGQIRNTDYSQAAERAQAADAIARFNAANRQDVMSRNVGERNEAQRLNLGVSQAINSQNVDQRNRVTEQNAAAPRQRYQDLLGHAGKIANVQAGTADLKSQQDTSQQAATGSFANTLANLFSQYNKQKPGA